MNHHRDLRIRGSIVPYLHAKTQTVLLNCMVNLRCAALPDLVREYPDRPLVALFRIPEGGRERASELEIIWNINDSQVSCRPFSCPYVNPPIQRVAYYFAQAAAVLHGGSEGVLIMVDRQRLGSSQVVGNTKDVFTCKAKSTG